jgi:hypothetical protein
MHWKMFKRLYNIHFKLHLLELSSPIVECMWCELYTFIYIYTKWNDIYNRHLTLWSYSLSFTSFLNAKDEVENVDEEEGKK